MWPKKTQAAGPTSGGREADLPPTPEASRAPDADAKVGIRRRWRSRRGALLMAAALLFFGWLIYIAPWIVAHTSMRRWVVDRFAATIHGTLEVDSVSLAWFAPPEAAGVRVLDLQDAPVLTIEQIACDRSLFDLLTDGDDLGTITLRGAKARITVDPAGTNLDDLFASSEEPFELPKSLKIETEGAVLAVDDRMRDRRWIVDGIRVSAELARGAAEPIEVSLTGRAPRSSVALDAQVVAPPENTPPVAPVVGEPVETPGGRLVAVLAYTAPRGETNGQATCAMELHDAPLGLTDLVGARLARTERIVGSVDGTISLAAHDVASWTELLAAPRWVIDADCAARRIAISAPWLGAEHIHSQTCRLAARSTWQDGLVQIEKLDLQTDVGHATLAGTLDPSGFSWTGLLNQVSERALRITGRVDLDKLAAMLPKTLHLQKGLRVTSGRLAWDVAAGPDRSPSTASSDDAAVWAGRIVASDLRAIRDGHSIVWDAPVSLMFRVRREQTPTVHLQCRSEFLNFDAAGNAKRLSAEGGIDLARLADQLGEFVDLGETSLAGNGWLRLDWQRTDDRHFEISATSQVDAFDLRTSQGLVWREPSLQTTLAASGEWDGELESAIRLDTGRIQLQGSDEWLVLRLLAPVVDLRESGPWSIATEGAGKLETWRMRLSPWIDLSAWTAAGHMALSSEWTLDGQSLAVGETTIRLTDLDVARPGFRFRDRRVELSADGFTWDDQWRRIQSPSLRWHGTALSARATDVLCKFSRAADDRQVPQLSGTLSIATSVDKVASWFPPSDPELVPVASPPAGQQSTPAPAAWRLAGDLSGDVQFQYGAGRTAFQMAVQVNDFRAQYASLPPLEEAHFLVRGNGSLAHATHVLSIANLSIEEAATLRGSVRGQLVQTPTASARLAGDVVCDWGRISEFARPYTKGGVRIAGRHACPFQYEGPLSLDGGPLAAGRGSLSLAWDEADVYGFQVGQGKIAATLAEGVVRFDPGDLTVSEGKLKSLPVLRRNSEDTGWEMAAEPGMLVERVRINQRMAAQGLQYIAPVLAGIAKAEGRFSIELTGGRIPLDNPAAAEIAGRLLVHDISIGPGFLVRELALLLGSPEMLQIAKDSAVVFRMTQGRIYHQRMTLVFPDTTVSTTGSVGIDQSVHLLVTMPIPEKWLGSDPRVNAALRDQVIQIPVTGTLSKPRLDPKTVEALSKRFLEKAATQVLQDEIQRGLQRLLGQ